MKLHALGQTIIVSEICDFFRISDGMILLQCYNGEEEQYLFSWGLLLVTVV